MPRAAEVIGRLGVEEVVGVAVHHEHCVLGPDLWTTPHDGGDQVTLAVGVGSQCDGLLPVPGQHVRLPLGLSLWLLRRHVFNPNCDEHHGRWEEIARQRRTRSR